MGLFDEEEENIKANYVMVMDVLDILYQKSDQGWYEVLHFLKNSSIETITTYSSNDGVIPEIKVCTIVQIEKVYEDGFTSGTLKDALCSFIANNLDHLDGEHLENKIITGSEFEKKFKQYAWLKSDIQSLKEFQKFDLINLIQRGRPFRKSKTKSEINNYLYKELIYCIEGFTERFNKPVMSIAKFLKQTKFNKHCDVYIRISNEESIKLNKINSEKAILFVLDFFDDQKFNKIDLGLDTDYFHLNHILIDEDDLLYFEPLKELIVDIKMGHDVYENIRFGDIKLNKLKVIEEYHYHENKKFFDAHWKQFENKEIKQVDIIEPSELNFDTHPSMNPNHPNHAPELLMAVEAWEAKYLNNEYPHQEHTPAIKTILKNKGISNTRLLDRISAITNPNKK